ncbi:MAG: hypothetical protein KF784_15325 [Fimbriimonadaceae bacterium]|nr:hypothetical protein [Fimbriimonadaceae bacterium]
MKSLLRKVGLCLLCGNFAATVAFSYTPTVSLSAPVAQVGVRGAENRATEALGTAAVKVDDALKAAGRAEAARPLGEAKAQIGGALGAAKAGDFDRAATQTRLAQSALQQAAAGARNASAAIQGAIKTAAEAVGAGLNAVLLTPTGFDVIMPSVAAEGESFTGLVVGELPEGRIDPTALAGEEVAVYSGTVAGVEKVGPKGQVGGSTLSNFLPLAAIPIIVTMSQQFGGKKSKPKSDPCTIVPMPKEELPPSIVNSTPTIGTDGVVRATGTNLNGLKNPALVSSTGQTIPIGDTDAGSSMEQLFVAQNVPAGEYTFQAETPDGKLLKAPNKSVKPSLRLSGPGTVQRGATGEIEIASNASGFVTLRGGQPQIALQKSYAYVEAGGSAKIPFTANVTGNYTVTAVISDEPPQEEIENPGVFSVSDPKVECTPNSGTNTTKVDVSTTLKSDKPVPNGMVDVMVTYPGGVGYERAMVNRNNIANCSLTVPKMIQPSLVNAYVVNAGGPNMMWNQVGSVFPGILCGSGLGGSSKKPPATPEAWDPVKWIDDFNAATKDVAEFEVTVYCDQPGNGGDRDAYEDGDVGHTFIEISGGGKSIMGGFYPGSPVSTVDVLTGADKDGKLVNDKDHPWDVKKTFKVKFADVEKMKQEWKKWKDKKYNLAKANCTDFVKEVCKAGGVTLPDGKSNWPAPMSGTSSSNPGALGEDLAKDGGTRK